MWILKDYIHSEKVATILNTKYAKLINGVKYSMTLEEIKSKYLVVKSRVSPSDMLAGNDSFKELEQWNKYLNEVNDKIYTSLLILLQEYSKEHLTDFIFPIVNPMVFKDVAFNEHTTLSKLQYNHMQSKTTIYNRSLKLLQKLGKIDLTLTSHLPRHTYTNLMLEND